MDTVRGRSEGQPVRLAVGVVDDVPKMLVRSLLQPALTLPLPVKLSCYEGAFDKLIGDLSVHALDLVISDAPVPRGSKVPAFTHFLGETDVCFFATRALAQTYAAGFPKSLHEAPVLLPLEGVPLRRSLDQFFAAQAVRPRLVAEFEDSALLKSFGADGVGLFPAPAAVASSVCQQYGVEVVGRMPSVTERLYALSVERRLKNPAVVAITDVARQELFAARRSGAVE